MNTTFYFNEYFEPCNPTLIMLADGSGDYWDDCGTITIVYD